MNELNLLSVFKMILNRIWLVIIAVVVFAASAFSYCTFFATPVYKSTASIMITNGAIITEELNSTVSNTDINASLYLVDTCVDILKAPKIYQELSKAIGEKYNYKALKGGFGVSKRSDTSLFIDFSFKSTDKDEAIKIVNAFATLSTDYLREIIPSAKVNIMSESDSASMVSPQTTITTFYFALIGALLSSAIIVVFNLLDQTIKGEEDLKNSFNLPVLGCVPDFDNVSAKGKKEKGKRR